MTLGELKNGLRIADFVSLDDVEIEPLRARFNVHIMRDGSVYMTQLPKRKKNTPIFRDDNCSLSLGRDGKYYFVFTMPEQLVNELPQQLVRQASAIAQKVLRSLPPTPPQGKGGLIPESPAIMNYELRIMN